MVRQPAVAVPKVDSTPATRSQFRDVLSPPRTRSGGRRTNTRSRSVSGDGPPAGRTRVPKVTFTPSPVMSPRKRTPRSRKPLTTLLESKHQPSVRFQLAKIPPASAVIPKPKTMKKTNVTMKRVKRQLDFDDIIPSPPKRGKTKGMKNSKKIAILMDLQDRLDVISPENSPVKQQRGRPPASRSQPSRGTKTTPSPSPRKVTVARLARQLKKELQQTSPELTPMSLRNGKVKFAVY